MPDLSKLKELLDKQNELAGEIAGKAAEFTSDRLLQDAERLKTDNELLRKNYSEAVSKGNALEAENKSLKETLQNQLYAERSRFLKNSEKKMAAYFGAGVRAGHNELAVLEREAKQKFDACRRALGAEFDNCRNTFNAKIQSLESEIADEAERLRLEYRSASSAANSRHRQTLSSLSGDKIDEQTANEVLKQSNVERVIGLNILGKIGAVFIIIAMITLSQLVYGLFDNDIFKCLFLFLAATLVFGFALFLNRKKRTVFSITIMALAIALEYTALSISYFTLDVLNAAGGLPALAVCIAVTAAAYIISARWKSEVVAVFAQIGGYLPVLDIFISMDMNLLYGAMVYFLILNALGFMVSMKYKWQILNFIDFGLNITGVILVSSRVAVMVSGEPFGLAAGLTLLFMFLSFALYTLLPVLTNCRIKTRFTKSDFILMALNTTVSLVLFYVMFNLYGAENWTGYLSLFFAACYFGLYLFVRKFFALDTAVRTLFWLTGLTFMALFVPMQFDERWLGFGWTIESAALVLYGIIRERKRTLTAGLVLSAFAVGSFLLFDVIMWKMDIFKRGDIGTDLFIYKYALVTLAAAAVLWAAVYKRLLVLGYLTSDGQSYRSQSVNAPQMYAAAVYLNTAGFLIYLIYKIFYWAGPASVAFPANIYYLMFALMITVLFAFAAVVPKLFKAYSVRMASLAAASIGLVWLIVINSIRLPAFGTDGSTGGRVAASFMLVILALMSIYVFYDLFIKAGGLAGSRRQGLIMAVALYSLFCYTHVLLVQYRLNFTNIAFSIAYIMAALICIGLGLYRHSKLTRRFALVLAVLAIAKLFILDTIALSLTYRFICYFVFGVVLIGMSFLYQMFYKKFAQKKIEPGSGTGPEADGGIGTEEIDPQTSKTEALHPQAGETENQ